MRVEKIVSSEERKGEKEKYKMKRGLQVNLVSWFVG